MTKGLIGILLLFVLSGYAQPAGYAWGKQLLVDGTKVSGSTNLINFTMLVNMIDPDLRSVSNGGHVESDNGYDIIFTYGDCGTTTLVHQLEKYDPVTGELIAWVKVNRLNATSNTNLHMYYGNPSVVTDPSSTGAWNTNVAAVYHLSNDDFSDGTSNAMNGTNMSSTKSVGKIGDSRTVGAGKYINVSESGTTSLDLTQLTMSAWVYPTDYNVASDRGIIVNKESRYEMGLRDLYGELQGASQPGCWRWAGTRIVPLNTWTLVTVVFAGGKERHYVNGMWIEDFTDCTNPLGTNDSDLRIGARGGDGSPGSYFIGRIDEVKLTNREETADWIKTEYNNQNDPNTFYIKSAEMTAHDLCFTLPIELNYFKVTQVEESVLLEWSTLSETENDYFEVQRSTDLYHWETITTVSGAGNSVSEIKYKTIDEKPIEGQSYYRIRQVDFNGEFSFSEIEIVDIQSFLSDLRCSPNPTRTFTYLEANGLTDGGFDIVVYNSLGKRIEVKFVKVATNKIQLDFANQPLGVYFVQVKEDKATKIVRFVKN